MPGEVLFRRSDLYKDTYLTKVLPYPSVKNKFRDFMEVKRTNPNQPFGASDKPFRSSGNFISAIPGLRHAHITFDLSIVYRVEGNQVFLYGFFTHDELGTGQPANINRQKSAATRFSNTRFI
jgi:mRNA-degrading endonuclease YafQ of YafQ-DinJ toxin-antitoxin module